MSHRVRKIAAAVFMVFSGATLAGTVEPYQAKEIKPYQAMTISPRPAKEVHRIQATEVKRRPASEVKHRAPPDEVKHRAADAPSAASNSSGEIKQYQATQAKVLTKKDFAAGDAKLNAEAKRIAAQRKGGVSNDPNVAANQLYWQQQIQHRQAEAANPGITYNGR